MQWLQKREEKAHVGVWRGSFALAAPAGLHFLPSPFSSSLQCPSPHAGGHPGAGGDPARGCWTPKQGAGTMCAPMGSPEVTPGSWRPAGRTPHVPRFGLQTGAEQPMRTSAPFPRPHLRLVARAVSVRFVSRPLNPGSAACVRKEGEKDEAMSTSVPNQLSARQKAFIYMYFILFG